MRPVLWCNPRTLATMLLNGSVRFRQDSTTETSAPMDRGGTMEVRADRFCPEFAPKTLPRWRSWLLRLFRRPFPQDRVFYLVEMP